MSRRDEEPVDVAEFASRESAEAAWSLLVAGGVPGSVLSDRPPWGSPRYRIQCARKDAATALSLLRDGMVEEG
jgi:hypothetical protein